VSAEEKLYSDFKKAKAHAPVALSGHLMPPDLLRLYMQPGVEALAKKIEQDLLEWYKEFNHNATS